MIEDYFEENEVIFQSSDLRTFPVNVRSARMSEVVRKRYHEYKKYRKNSKDNVKEREIFVFKVTDVKGDVLEKIIEWCVHHQFDQKVDITNIKDDKNKVDNDANEKTDQNGTAVSEITDGNKNVDNVTNGETGQKGTVVSESTKGKDKKRNDKNRRYKRNGANKKKNFQMSEWDENFFKFLQSDLDFFMRFLAATEFLNIPTLRSLVAMIFTNFIEGKTVGEIQKFFEPFNQPEDQPSKTQEAKLNPKLI